MGTWSCLFYMWCFQVRTVSLYLISASVHRGSCGHRGQSSKQSWPLELTFHEGGTYSVDEGSNFRFWEQLQECGCHAAELPGGDPGGVASRGLSPYGSMHTAPEERVGMLKGPHYWPHVRKSVDLGMVVGFPAEKDGRKQSLLLWKLSWPCTALGSCCLCPGWPLLDKRRLRAQWAALGEL